MFTTKWTTSERKYDVIVERDVKVRMPDGVTLAGHIYQPASGERFPVILGAHAYNKNLQSPPMRPVGFTPMRGYMESGDSTFFARRGYIHAVFNVRGSGISGGFYQLMGPLEVRDVCDLIDWLAAQSWSNGDVGMFGVSYFARLAKAVAALRPKPLKAIFAPFAGTDDYRHRCYHGGILAHGFLTHWRNSLHRPNYRSLYKEAHGEAAYKEAIAQAMRDEEIMAVPGLREALQNPDVGTNALVVDVLLNPFDGEFWHERSAHDANATVPAYLCACWGNYGLHLPGAFTAWKDWNGPKKMVIGPEFISIARCISIKMNHCGGLITGSKASTPASWTSRRSVASFRPPANGKFSTIGRRPRRAGRRFTCTRMKYSANTNSGQERASIRSMNHLSNTALRPT